MKKLIKITVIVAGIMVLLIIGLSFTVKSYLSSDRLKALILPKAEAITGRKVQLEEIQVSLFRGIISKDFRIKEEDGKTDFISIGKFVFSYRLLPLLKKELVISKIAIISPSINIKKERGGKYNFSDMIKEKPSPSPQTASPPSEHQGLPVSVVADRFSVQDARFRFIDEEKTIPDLSARFDAEFKGGIEKDGTPRMDYGEVLLREMEVRFKDQKVKISGKINLNAKTIQAKFQAWVGKDSIDIAANAKNYLSAPEIEASLYAKALDIEPLMKLSGDKKLQENRPISKQEKAGVSKPAEGSMIQKMKAEGEMKVDRATYQDYVVKDFRMRFQYANGILKVVPLGMKFSGEGSFVAEGGLQGDLQLAVKEGSTIQKTVRGTSEAKLGKGAIRESKIFDAIAYLTGIPSLKSPGFDNGLFHFNIEDEKIFLDGWIESSFFKIIPKGTIDFEKRMDIPTELRLSPQLLGNLKGKLSTMQIFQDENGWGVIPLKITGTTENPRVSLDENALKKALGRGLRRELERRFLEPKSGEPENTSKKRKAKDILRDFLQE